MKTITERSLELLRETIKDYLFNKEITSDMIEKMICEITTAHAVGRIEGLTDYAWWKDGTQYVGTCGTTLKEACENVKRETIENLKKIGFKDENIQAF